MKVLLVSYYYPPDRAVGGQRAKKVAEAFASQGHDVQVLAAGLPTVESGLRRVAPLPSARGLYAWSRDRLSVGSEERKEHESDEASGSVSPSRTTPAWKRWIFSLIWLPDDKQGFVPPAVCAASRLMSEKPDIIYTTGPPSSVHLAGLLLKAITGARWVAEFRDPWTANPWKPSHLRSAFSDWLEKRLEWLCLESADLLVAVSEGIEKRLAETGTGTPRITVRNGIAEVGTADEAAAEDRSDRPFMIVHAGSFYHARDPFPFLQALERLVKDESVDPSRLRVRLIGATEAYDGRSIRGYLKQSDLDRHVRVEGWMEAADAIACVRGADLLFLLALDQPDQVPNKLYEYLGTRRPILAVADEDGETARMLDRVGGHTVVSTNDAELIHRALRGLFEERRTRPVGDVKVLKGWKTSAQMDELLKGIETHITGSPSAVSPRAASAPATSA